MKSSTEFELRGLGDAPSLSSRLGNGPSGRNQDDIDLSRARKKPILKRNFGFMAILGFNCLILDTWEGSMIVFGPGFKNGGPAGLFYGFIFVWLGSLATFTSLAELASMAPTAGGQYHWVSMLAPKNCQKFLSFITGWLTVTGWQAGIASTAFISGTLIQGLIQLVDPTYMPRLWHGTLLYYAVLLLSIFIDAVVGTTLPGIESMMLVLYILGFFGVLVPLVYLGPHSSSEQVFKVFLNNGNWSSQGLSFFIGLSGYAFAFLGSDSVYHMSEEVRNAAIVVPRTLILGILLDGVFGISMLIAVLFCIGDVDAVINTKYNYPFIEILLQATNSVPGTAVLMSIIIVVDLGLCMASMAASSRMLWAFARDRGLPGWKTVSKVNKRTSIPTTSLILTTLFSFLLGLISIGSPIAFNDVISLSLCSLYASYFIACTLLLWRRCTNAIKRRTPAELEQRNSGIPSTSVALVWGPWRIPGLMGIGINIFACVYLLIVFFFSLWPPAVPVTGATMNYSSLVMGAVMIFSTTYYLFSAHKTYNGPVVEMEPLE